MSGVKGKTTCVVGTQWGDEGKGKIVDVISEECDAVVRFQGGANAGHTVKIAGIQHILHLLPTGILRSGKKAILGGGMAIDPATLLSEIETLHRNGIETGGRLFISERAHVVMPYHKLIDRAREENAGNKRIGTTLRGIGPCYEDKASRRGIRVAELIRPRVLKSRLEHVLPEKNELLQKVFGRKPLELEELFAEMAENGRRLKEAVADVTGLLYKLEAQQGRILFEGAQGALLDVDLGTYPYVTSSNTCIGAIGTGTGFSPRKVDEVMGIVKAYTTRVGEGPFPSEAPFSASERLRGNGGEYGATTGRPRRCGWLDLTALKNAIRAADVDTLVVTKLDVLDTLEEIKVAVSYSNAKGRSGGFPATFPNGEKLDIEWITFPGWQTATGHCRTFEELPKPCRDYLLWIAGQTGRPIRMVSVGPDRRQVIPCEPPLTGKAE